MRSPEEAGDEGATHSFESLYIIFTWPPCACACAWVAEPCWSTPLKHTSPNYDWAKEVYFAWAQYRAHTLVKLDFVTRTLPKCAWAGFRWPSVCVCVCAPSNACYAKAIMQAVLLNSYGDLHLSLIRLNRQDLAIHYMKLKKISYWDSILIIDWAISSKKHDMVKKRSYSIFSKILHENWGYVCQFVQQYDNF